MIFIIDFDGTIAPIDTVDSLLGRFADPAWELIEADWAQGKINSRACLQGQLGLISADRQALEVFLKNVGIDPHFASFARHVSGFADVAVVSDGLDYPINHALQKIGLSSIPVFANKAVLNSNGLDVSFPHSSSECVPQSGVCKCKVARSFDSSPVVLIGDGRSDYCLARSADYIFAKGKLGDFCETEGLSYTSFNSFDDILNVVKRWEKVEAIATNAKRYAT
ncbi:MAG: MtnX-like HAD-IB family phosphatase [Sulfuricaulis sp.]